VSKNLDGIKNQRYITTNEITPVVSNVGYTFAHLTSPFPLEAFLLV